MKKAGFGLFAIVLLMFTMLPMVSAGPAEDIGNLIEGILTAFYPLLDPLFGLSASSGVSEGSVILTRLLFFVIIFSVVWLAFGQIEFFERSKPIHILLSVAVAILSTRWLGDASVVEAVLLPYDVLGFAISALLPFVAWFVIVEIGMKEQPAILRRTAWIFFAIVFIALWFIRYDIWSAQGQPLAKWIYPGTAILALAMAYFDGTLQRFRNKINREKLMTSEQLRQRTQIQSDMNRYIRQRGKGDITEDQFQKLMRDAEKRLDDVDKAIKTR